MPSSSTGIGLIGTGGIAAQHAHGLVAAGAHLVAASDPSPSALERFRSAHGLSAAQTFADHRQLLADPRVQAVVVATPHDLHEPLCTEALAAGKHVLVEKPIARTVEEAGRMQAAAVRANRLLMVGHNQRFDPRHRAVRTLLQQGQLGRVTAMTIDHYQDFSPPATSWWRRREPVGGGCVIGSGIHRLDLLRWFLGEPEVVASQVAFDPDRLEGEVACSATLAWRTGAVATFLCHWGVHHSRSGEHLGVYGTTGSIQLVRDEPGTLERAPRHALEPLAPEPGETMWAQFLRCAASGETPLTSAAEGTATLALTLRVAAGTTAAAPLARAAGGR